MQLEMNWRDACRTSSFISKKTLEPAAPFSLFSGPRASSYCGSSHCPAGAGPPVLGEPACNDARLQGPRGGLGEEGRVSSGCAWSPSLGGGGLGPPPVWPPSWPRAPRPGPGPPALSTLHSNSARRGRTAPAGPRAPRRLRSRDRPTGRRCGRGARRRWGPDGPADARSARAAACPSGGSPRVGGGRRGTRRCRPCYRPRPAPPLPNLGNRPPPPPPRPPFPRSVLLPFHHLFSPRGHCPDGTGLF